MPIAYQCYLCDRYFTYEYVRVRVLRPANKNEVMTIKISCKQPTSCDIGQTGNDYVCGDCIEKNVRQGGLT